MKNLNDNFIKNNLFLFDTFEECIILANKRDKNAPPERYFIISGREDSLDIYIDTYWVDRQQKQVIDFAYSYEESWNINQYRWCQMLYAHFERHGLEIKEYDLRSRIYPKKRFYQLLEQYYQQEDRSE